MEREGLCFLTIGELADLLRKREVSPVEATEAVLARVEQLEGRVHAYITVTREEARRAAQEAERAIRSGNYRGPLHGIPVSLKDNIYTRGVRTTGGARILRDHIPDHDATLVERLKAAGAVIVGKTNMHEFAYGATTNNPHYGPTHNPWDLERIPGGSSGGSAAAVAASLCIASIGTDTGGSIRIPSSLCGVVGLKQTYGRVSRHGVIPLSWSLDHAGPITRNVEDAGWMLQAIAGVDPRDPTTRDLPVPDYAAALNGEVRGLRCAVPREYVYARLDREVEAAFREALRTLEGLGVEVEEISLPRLAHAPTAELTIILAEASAYHQETLRQRADEYGPDVRAFLEMGELLLATHYLKAQRAQSLLRQEMQAVLQRADLLLMPTAAIPAPRIGEESVQIGPETVGVVQALIHLTCPFNLTGLPALTLPGGFTPSGLPIGLQIAGRPFEEATVLRLAHAYEIHTPWRQRRPAL
ncbi:MAG: Asp-tRNA(Asn)/Glu-tRNA(Gln) amidotransferase subunit GatA [Candidatus Tectomicrobia bacterium]|uniref:Asp-tRNA(Asn)/Glu-tRNA(Gln) amidotransferase subunit GatA n=1 Tax=Tectimicrobiota bacterium TaxID=2528274 RepID=A0A932CSQ4_UNCTE|nr:Asp-tRNA(Asn)/Glu-tRNA(Gln) amidotransferase subunit GatA [Candidatus Tectomicrobia bacterium]